MGHKNLEDRQAYHKTWRACNQEYLRRKRKAYYTTHKEEILEQQKRYHEKNRKRILVDRRNRRKANLAEVRAKEKKRYENNPELFLLYSARRRAKLRGLEFNLSLEDIVIPKTCPVLGIPIVPGKGSSRRNSASLDRIDNTKGYTKDNVIVVSFRVNNLKSDATVEELRRIVSFYERLSNG
jgi:hypothetical protein